MRASGSTGRREPRGRKSESGERGGAKGGLRPKRQFTPEERRQAVEAYRASGLTQKAFAAQWGVSHMTIHGWAKRYEAEGPKGLERLSPGPVKRRGRAPLAEGVKAEIEAVQRRFPTFGLKRVRDWLKRFSGVKVSAGSVRKVVAAAGLPRAPAARRRRRSKPPSRRFERARPGELWQTDITYLQVPWRKGPLYLIAFLDDHSRYVVGHGLFAHQRQEIALEVFEEAILKFGKPAELLSDQGRQFHSWRGRSEFRKLLEREGIQHVLARAHHPETVGKCERFWKTLKTELWDRIHPKDLEEARERIRLFIGHYNHFRPNQGIGGGVPADRFFGVKEEVRRAIEAGIEKNALRLALGEAPRRPVFLVGQIDGQAVSMHGEQGRLVVQTSEGMRKEIETKDLGINPEGKVSDGNDEASGNGEREHDGGDDTDDEPGDGERDDDAAGGAGVDGGGGRPPAPAGTQAAAVPGAPDAEPGAGAVGGGERAGAGAGAPGGDGGASDVAGPSEP